MAHGAKRVEQFGAHLVRTRRCLLGKRNREYLSHSWPHEQKLFANEIFDPNYKNRETSLARIHRLLLEGGT
jgi:hypothetical protein